MWLVILAMAAALTTAFWYWKAESDLYKLNILALIFWGATIMVLVDHVMGYLMEGGEFLEITSQSIVLGVVLVIAALVVWEIILIIKDPKKVFQKR